MKEEPKEELMEEETDFSKAKRALASSVKPDKKPRERKVDGYCHVPAAKVVDDWDCMLNQTNIGQNNNKFYVIQLLKAAR